MEGLLELGTCPTVLARNEKRLGTKAKRRKQQVVGELGNLGVVGPDDGVVFLESAGDVGFDLCQPRRYGSVRCRA